MTSQSPSSNALSYVVSVIGWLALLLVQLFGTGCGNVEQYGFEVSNDVCLEYSVLVEAAEAWCVATDGIKCPGLVGGDSSISFTTDVLPAAEGVETLGLTAWMSDGTSRIYLHIDAGTDRNSHEWLARVRLVAVHEMGHALGCHGHLWPKTLMFAPIEGAADHITQADIDCVMGDI